MKTTYTTQPFRDGHAVVAKRGRERYTLAILLEKAEAEDIARHMNAAHSNPGAFAVDPAPAVPSAVFPDWTPADDDALAREMATQGIF